MKIDKILFTSDSNVNYLSFWPSISKFYYTQYGLVPHLFFIGQRNDECDKYLTTKYGDITYINPIDNIPIIIQALWGKFWFTQTEPETTWLIGDIDLYLLKTDYINNCIKTISNNSYVHLNANGYKKGSWWENDKLGIPGYWHLSTGKLFKQYLQLSDSFEEDCKYILNSKKYGILYKGIISSENLAPNRVKDKNDCGYICCEEHLSTERLKQHRGSMKCFTYPSIPRLEIFPNGNQPSCDFNLLEWYKNTKRTTTTNYIDFHAPRPYNCFSETIEEIVYDALN